MASALKRNFLKLNLFISQTNQPKLYLRAFKWLLSSGRFLVVIVEFVVIAGFVARFKLDADLADLQDQIKSQIPYIESLKNQEINIRKTQFQLSTIRQTTINQTNLPTILQAVAANTPKNIKITNINLTVDQTGTTGVQITGISFTNYEIAAFLKALHKDNTFLNINLSNISFDKKQIDFTITGSARTKGSQRKDS